MGFYVIDDAEMNAMVASIKEKTGLQTLPGNQMKEAIESICVDNNNFNAIYKTNGEPIDIVANDLTTIPSLAGNKNIRSIEIRNVTSLPQSCFSGCTNLEKVILGNVTYLGNNIFAGCIKLTKIEGLNKVTNMGNYCFQNCSSLNNLEELSSLTEIGSCCFKGCSSLESFNAPNLTKLNGATDAYSNWYYNHFEDCVSLKEVNIPKAPLARSLFRGCSSLETFVFNEANSTLIPQFCFSNCGIKEYTVPPTITTIEQYAFQGSSIESITLTQNITSIQAYAFSDCNKLASINLEDTKITALNSYTFYNCISLKTINFPETLTSIKDNVFRGIGITNITIPDTIKEIGTYAFSECQDLEEVVLPNAITAINTYTFWNCKKLKTVEIPTSVKYLYQYCFAGCESIEELKIPNGVIRIDDYALHNMKKLKTLYIPESVTTYSNQNGNNFNSLETLYYAGNTSAFYYNGLLSTGGFPSLRNIYLLKDGKYTLSSGNSSIVWRIINAYYTYMRTMNSSFTYEQANSIVSDINIYVPASQENTYKSDSNLVKASYTSSNNIYQNVLANQIHSISMDVIIGGTTYEGFDSVTWEQFVSHSSSNNGFVVSGNNILTSNKTKFVKDENGIPVKPTDAIIFGTNYTLESI